MRANERKELPQQCGQEVRLFAGATGDALEVHSGGPGESSVLARITARLGRHAIQLRPLAASVAVRGGLPRAIYTAVPR